MPLAQSRNVYKVELIINLKQFHLVSFFVSMDVALIQLNVVWASHERCCLQNAEKINDTQSRAELNIRKSPRKPQWFSNRCLMKFVLTCSFFKYPLYVVLIVLTNMKNQNIHTHCEKAFVAQLFDFILSSVPVKLVLLSLLNIFYFQASTSRECINIVCFHLRNAEFEIDSFSDLCVLFWALVNFHQRRNFGCWFKIYCRSPFD